MDQRPFPETLEHLGPSPLLDTVVGGGRRPVASRESAPLVAGNESVEDRLHASTIVRTRTATERARSVTREKTSDPSPQGVGQSEAALDHEVEEGEVRGGHRAALSVLSIEGGLPRARVQREYSDGLQSAPFPFGYTAEPPTFDYPASCVAVRDYVAPPTRNVRFRGACRRRCRRHARSVGLARPYPTLGC